MGEIVFNSEGEYYRGDGGRGDNRGGLAGWLVRVSGGLIKNEVVANRVLLFLSFVVFLIAFLVLRRSF